MLLHDLVVVVKFCWPEAKTKFKLKAKTMLANVDFRFRHKQIIRSNKKK